MASTHKRDTRTPMRWFSQRPLSAFERPDSTYEEVLAETAPEWREAAEKAAAARAILSGCSALTHVGYPPLARDFEARGVKVLLKDKRTDHIHLGVFDIPALPPGICDSPEGFNMQEQQRFFLQQQRHKWVQSFMSAMLAKESWGYSPPNHPYGVFLHGSSGVGKSAIGLQTFLTCFATGLPVVYIPSAEHWMNAANAGRADDYFFRTLLHQSADVILKDPVWRSILAPVLRGETAMRMTELYSPHLWEAKTTTRLGIIVDNAHFTLSELAAQAPSETKYYFRWWYYWIRYDRRLVRMDLAENRHCRAVKFSSGEERRMNPIYPWPKEHISAAIGSEASPLYFPAFQGKARDRILATGGGVIGTLFRGKQLLSNCQQMHLSRSKQAEKVEADLKAPIREGYAQWFHGLSESDQLSTVCNFLKLLRGEAWYYWKCNKVYDELTFEPKKYSNLVKPVSRGAASVMMDVIAHHIRTHGLPVPYHYSFVEARGRRLQLLVISRLLGNTSSLHFRSFHGKLLGKVTYNFDSHIVVPAHASVAEPFEDLKQLASQPNAPCAYVSTSWSFPHYCILMPAKRNKAAPIVVFDCSGTDPRSHIRIAHSSQLFREKPLPSPNKTVRASGDDREATPKIAIVSRLRAAYPNRHIVCAICWDEVLTTEEQEYNGRTAEEAWRAMADSDRKIQFCILDKQVLDHPTWKMQIPGYFPDC